MTRILQIAPGVPPAVCGIGDYAWLLAQELKARHDIHTDFLDAKNTGGATENGAGFSVYNLPALTADALVNFIAARPGSYQVIVLHVSLYGYQKRGVPLWLAAAVKRLSRLQGAPRLVTMFHELYASSSVRGSAFWLKPLQKHVLRVIAIASDGIRTNRNAYAEWLKNVSGVKATRVSVLPVFSNVGEPATLPSFDQRATSMVYFASGVHAGGDGVQSMQLCYKLAEKMGMRELHVLGGSTQPASSGIAVIRHKFLPAEDLSSLLLRCCAAFSAYPPQYLAKSGIVAGFAAHGLPMILSAVTDMLPDELSHGKEFLRLDTCLSQSFSDAELARVGSGLHEWYQNHSLSRTALSYSNQIFEIMEKEPLL